MARWYTVEFVLWYLIILKVYCRKLPDAAAELAEMCNQDRRCSSYLHHSYFWPKYPIDLSDIQWREYRKVLPLLSLAAAAHILARAALGRRRIWPCLMLSGAFVLYVHGAHTIFVIAACFGSYALAKVCGVSRWAPFVAWAYGLLMIAIKLSEVRISFGFLGPFGYWLNGLQSHDWHQSLSLLCLRLISFNMDYYWTLKELKDTKVDDAQAKVTSMPSSLYKTREQQSRDLEEYNITNCLAYCFYSPLWLAGPTTTFNAFTSHIRDRSQEAVVGWKLLLYATRLLFCFVLLEVMLHSCPVWAIGRSSLYLKVQRPDLLASYAMMMLIAMWLKFLIIWRFARLWALCDGIEVVENMQRCVCNNYCITSFWRGWHVSFNRWLVRYLYVPLGGRKYRLVNVWLVFGFVALWHDAELKLLAWGMLNALFMVGESLAACVWRSKVFSTVRALPETSRWVRAAAGASYVYVLFFVNLTGYALGVGGTASLAQHAFLEDWAPCLETLVCTAIFLFAAVQVMLELRECGLCVDGAG
ncbi:unnamed protein product [Cladocopium goreaui]|uniref:Membrane-bound O-acyltransferase C24H6.01c n=1 Tax=Cladocopium goreaui TaxID=2562237 RepID=A0A9P1DWF7_9DINO|nr:unnamed protein product [Cladocopium goreaui]